jgi:hypothetical protein
MRPGPISLREAAILYMGALQRRGAVFTLRANDDWHCDLDGCDGITNHDEAEDISGTLFLMRDEIRAVLVSLRVQH